MPDSKQPHLNGAYYGPSIPPPSETYHRPGRGGPGCGICSCLCSCLCSLIFQILCTIVLIIGVTIFILWLIFRPNEVKFHVTDANLTQFNHSTTNNMLYYNLSLNMTVRNPNKRIGIYYDRIEARAFFEDQRFDAKELGRFYQGHKKTNYLNTTFQGQSMVVLGDSELSKYNSQTSSGTYNIDVKLYLRIRLKFGVFKSPKFKPKVKCDLKVPLLSATSAAATTTTTFQATKCDYDW